MYAWGSSMSQTYRHLRSQYPAQMHVTSLDTLRTIITYRQPRGVHIPGTATPRPRRRSSSPDHTANRGRSPDPKVCSSARLCCQNVHMRILSRLFDPCAAARPCCCAVLAGSALFGCRVQGRAPQRPGHRRAGLHAGAPGAAHQQLGACCGALAHTAQSATA